ncbi:MAG: sugar transferase [Planctomycetaceae bacterium]|nr:sugar transferase [Planctomycetaceae bacterium]
MHKIQRPARFRGDGTQSVDKNTAKTDNRTLLFVNLNMQPKVSRYYRIKWYVDVAVSIITLPVIGSVILLFMLLTRLTSKGPVIYTQIRCSKDGKPFSMYKIRSMVVDAEAKTGAVWASVGKRDPRITAVGRIMRKLHIDELPQIVNVWRGEMTVIGPRPERPEFVEKLKTEIPCYEGRMTVLPGLTGYAQLNRPADTDLKDVRKKLILDLEYIEQASFCLDMRILLGTAFKFIRFRYFDRLPLRLCGICRDPENSPWAAEIGLEDFEDN